MVAAIPHPNDPVLALVHSLSEATPWMPFLTALIARTHATHGALIIASAGAAPERDPIILQHAGPSAVRTVIDIAALIATGLFPYRSLRQGRVYAIEEMLDFDDAERRAHQRRALSVQGIAFGRWLRISVDGTADAWILLTREREDFTASAVATLSAVGPYVGAALRVFAGLSEQHLRRMMSEAALGRLGIGQIALDETAHVMAADEVASRHLPLVGSPGGRPGRRVQLARSSSERLERACAEFAAGGDAALPVLVDVNDTLTLMVQPATLAVLPGVPRPVAIATIRVPVREDERRGAAVLRDQFRLSAREAALAEKLSRGERIAEAGQQLHLTEETARNYSKRIYARTGSRGQADLVRTILCSLAPLA